MKEISLGTTLAAGVAVLALWGASWALSGAELGSWSIVIALGIAAIKAALVAVFFMELPTEKRSVRVAAASGVVMVALMISFMVLDVRTRWTPPFEPQTAVRQIVP